MPAWSLQNSSQVKPSESSILESRTCLRHCARAAEQLPVTTAKACWRPIQEPRSICFSVSIACLGNDRCENRRRFVPTKRVSAGTPLGTKGSARVRFAGRPGGPADVVVELLSRLDCRARVLKNRGSAEGDLAVRR